MKPKVCFFKDLDYEIFPTSYFKGVSYFMTFINSIMAFYILANNKVHFVSNKN